MLAAAFRALLTPVQKRGQDFFEALGIEQPILQMAGYQIVQLLHRDRAALATRLALPGFDRAGVVPITPALAGSECHGSAAVGAEADAGKEGWAADDAGGRHFRIARAQMRLHGVERGLIDDRRDRDRHHLADGFQLLGFGALVELVCADIGAAGQDTVDLPDTPPASVAGEDAMCVQIGDDLLHTERAARSIPFQEQPIDQPHGVGMERIDLQFLLGLGAPLFGGDDPIADRRQRAVPEALPGVLLQGAQDMLGVLLGLVLIEQCHDLPHHDVHRIIAHLLGDGDEPDAVLRKPADVELQLEVIAEETREAVNDDDVERRWFTGSRFDHFLKLGPPVIGGRGTRFHIGLDKLVAARLAIGFALPPLVGNRHVMLGLPDGRDAQVKGCTERHGPLGCVHGVTPQKGPSSSSKISPNQASNTSTSRCVTGTRSGQSSMTVQAERSCFGGRPKRRGTGSR
ncbi:MAG: hypothetical protein WDM81_06330 [Rhizomicrobium sp.]